MKCCLVLEEGKTYRGICSQIFERAGEVVFNTSHQGYEEIATDPSYFSQIVILTAPMQGNYGIQSENWESNQIYVEGFISLEMQNSIQNRSWLNSLTEAQRSWVTGIPTRELVLKIREGGTPWGAIVKEEGNYLERAQELIQEKKRQDLDWVYQVSTSSAKEIKGHKMEGPKIGLLDFGYKKNILRLLQEHCAEIVVLPSRSSAQEILSLGLAGLVLSNGPGDPADVQIAPQTIKELIGKIPIFGICMGHQLLGRSLGAKTFKMPFGHRGGNHPVKDLRTGHVYMTSQNHGYAIDMATLPEVTEVTHINLNDQTVAGLANRRQNYFSVQFHPESSPGPHEARMLFNEFFIEMI